MKLDTTGLETHAPLCRESSAFLDGVSAPPSFEVPTTNDVSFFMRDLQSGCCLVACISCDNLEFYFLPLIS